MAIDSKLEGRYYARLILMKAAGEIVAFEHHPDPLTLYTLQITRCSQRKGRYLSELEHHYTPDFCITLKSGTKVMVEIKGHLFSRDGYRFNMAAYMHHCYVFQMIKWDRKKCAWHVVKEYNNFKLEEI